jgi:GH24 family phage-related lysozyme (muramidase)
MALVNPPTLNLNPFRYGETYRAQPVRPILNGNFGPPDQAEMFQKGIGGLLPALASAYEGVKGRVKADEAGAETRLIGTDQQTPGAAVTSLAQPGAPYGPAPKILDAGTPGGKGDPGMQRQYDDPSYALLRQEEGFRDKPYNDSGSLRVGYGSDTYTDASGNVGKVGPGLTITRDMAEADLRRRVTEFQNGIRKDVPNFDTLPAGTRAALTSVAYNYGSLPPAVVEAARAGNNQVLAASVASLDANPQRRQREAALIFSSGTSPVTQGQASTAAAPAGGGGGAGNLSDPANAYRARLQQNFPQVQITSEYRSPQTNQRVGGVSGSQHLSGNALDINTRGMSEEQKAALIDDAIANGAGGIGWYNANSMHIDFRKNPMAWGPDTHRASLGQTPPWFQERANRLFARGGAPSVDTMTASTQAAPGQINAGNSMAGNAYDATKPVPPQQAIQPMPGQNPSAVAQSQVAQPQQRPPQPQQAAFTPLAVQTPPPGPQGGPGAPQAPQQAPAQLPNVPPAPQPQGRVQVASADPAFVPGGPAPGNGIAIDPATGQRQAVDANGNPLPAAAATPAQRPPVQPAPQQVAGPAQQQQGPGIVRPASPQQIAQTAAQVDPHYRNALAAAIESRDPNVMRGVIEAGEKLLGGKDQYDFVNGPDGHMYRVNKRTGVPELAIRGAGKPTEIKEINGVSHEWNGQKWVPVGGNAQEWHNATPEERTAAGARPEDGPMLVNRNGEYKFPAKQGGTNVSVNTAGETAQEKKLGEARADQIIKTGNAAEAATGTLRRVAQMRAALEGLRTQSGKFAPGRSTVGALAASLGLSDATLETLGLPDRNQIANAEQINALQGQLVRGMLASGEFPTNNFSDADRTFLLSQLPGLGQTNLGNELLLRAMEMDAQRSVEKQAAWRRYRLGQKAAGGKADWEEFTDQWQETLNSDKRGVIDRPANLQEYNALPPGSIYIDPETKQPMRKR